MTKKEMRRAVKWFQENVGCKDWKVDVYLGAVPPLVLGDDLSPKERKVWYGRSLPMVQYHKAHIWINTAMERDEYSDETWTLFHELLHCFFEANGIDAEGPPVEWALNQLAGRLKAEYDSVS